MSIGAAQLPRQPHRLPRAGPDRRQLPARRRRSWSRSTGPIRQGVGPARLARASRSRASVRARQPVRPAEQPRRAAPPAGRQEPAQRRPRWRSTCSCGGCTCSGCILLAGAAVDLYAALGLVRRSRWTSALTPLFTVVYFVLVERAVTGVPARCGRCTARSTTATSGGTNATGRCPAQATCRPSTAPRSRTSSGGCWASGWAGGSSTTAAAHDRADAGRHRRRLHAQRRQRHPVPLAGGRRLQVRPHQHRSRLHARRRRLRPLRRDDGRRRGARPRLLPDEGRGGPRARAVGRQPGPAADRARPVAPDRAARTEPDAASGSTRSTGRACLTLWSRPATACAARWAGHPGVGATDRPGNVGRPARPAGDDDRGPGRRGLGTRRAGRYCRRSCWCFRRWRWAPWRSPWASRSRRTRRAAVGADRRAGDPPGAERREHRRCPPLVRPARQPCGRSASRSSGLWRLLAVPGLEPGRHRGRGRPCRRGRAASR